ncbi:MAG: UxaA family hydrolase, partial [Sphaerochaetaceae bacterium]|nr:UxaA family hydrolase [Sphaerochaetaceae bacterium]
MNETLKIHPSDNVAVALCDIENGAEIQTGSISITTLQNIPAGHKVALCRISKGKDIIKYGYPIGMATEDIPAGSHVHTHNIRTLL